LVVSSLLVFSLSFNADRIIFDSGIFDISSGSTVGLTPIISRVDISPVVLSIPFSSSPAFFAKRFASFFLRCFSFFFAFLSCFNFFFFSSLSVDELVPSSPSSFSTSSSDETLRFFDLLLSKK